MAENEQTKRPTNVNVDKRSVSGAEIRADRAFRAMREDAIVQNRLTQDTIRDKMAQAITEAAPLIAGLGLLKQTDSPALAIGGAYLTDKIKDQIQARAARKKAEKEEFKQRRLAAQIAIRQGRFQDEEEAMQEIAKNRLAQEESRIAEEQEQQLIKMGIIDKEELSKREEAAARTKAAAEEAANRKKAAEIAVREGKFQNEEDALQAIEKNRAEQEKDKQAKEDKALLEEMGIVDREKDLLAKKEENLNLEAELLRSPDSALGVERAEPGTRAEMTEALRQLTDIQRESLGIQVAGTDQAIVDGETGKPLSNAAMEEALVQHEENLSSIDQNIGHLVDIQTNAAIDANKDRLAAAERAREAGRAGAPVPSAQSKDKPEEGEEGGGGLFSRFGRNRKSRKPAGGKGGKGGIGGTLGKLVGGFAGQALASFVMALGNPAMLKAAAIFMATAPMIGAGIGLFITAVSAGIAAASWIMGKALPTLADGMDQLAPVLKKYEELDGNKLSGAAGGMKDMLGGLASVGVGGLISELGDTSQLKELAGAVKEFEQIDGEKLKLIGPAMIDLGKGMGATGLGAVAGAIGEFFSGGSPKDQYKDLAEGLGHFNTIDTDKLTKVGPAVEALGTGLSGMGGGKLKGALGGLANAFGSLFGAKDDPIANIKRFAAELGEQELSNQLTIAGQGIKNLGDGLSAFEGAKIPEGLDDMIDPLTKIFGAVGKLGPDAGIQFNKMMRSFHNLKGLEKVDFATVGPGFSKLGDGLEDFVDYVRDDDGPKVISEAAEAIGKFAAAMGKVEMSKEMGRLAAARQVQRTTKPTSGSTSSTQTFLAGEPWKPGQPLSENQFQVLQMSQSMGNQLSQAELKAMQQYSAMKSNARAGQALAQRSASLTLANGGVRFDETGTLVVNNNNNSQNTTNNQTKDVRTRSNESTLAKKAWRSTHLNFAAG